MTSAVQVEGSDDGSDDDASSDNAAGPSLTSPITSPLSNSKRARKRQAAAAKKRLVKEAQTATETASAGGKKLQVIGTSNGANGTKNVDADRMNGASTPAMKPASPTRSKDLPLPKPTIHIESQPVQPQANGNDEPRSASIVTPKERTSSLLAPSSSYALAVSASKEMLRKASGRSSATGDDGQSIADTEDYEDTSLLIDEDEESSTAASESEAEPEDLPAGVRTPENGPNGHDDLRTPRASNAKDGVFMRAQKSMDETAHNALSEVTKSDAAPEGVKEVAKQAKDIAAAPAPQGQPHGSDHDPSKKWKAVITRTIWTLLMIAGFCGTRTASQQALGH